jgi:hypothetical protein
MRTVSFIFYVTVPVFSERFLVYTGRAGGGGNL